MFRLALNSLCSSFWPQTTGDPPECYNYRYALPYLLIYFLVPFLPNCFLPPQNPLSSSSFSFFLIPLILAYVCDIPCLYSLSLLGCCTWYIIILFVFLPLLLYPLLSLQEIQPLTPIQPLLCFLFVFYLHKMSINI